MNIEARIGQIACDHGPGIHSIRAAAANSPAPTRRPILSQRENGRWQMPSSRRPKPNSHAPSARPKTNSTATTDRPAQNGSRKRCGRPEENKYELKSLMRISNAVLCLKQKKTNNNKYNSTNQHATATYITNII